MKKLLVFLSIVLLVVSVCGTSMAVTITFDELPAENWDQAPNNALSNEYAYLGINFVNTDDGSIWDGLSGGDPGNWALEGTNGDNFLGYNGASYSADLLFDAGIYDFSFDVSRSSGSSNGDSFTVNAYDNSNTLLESQTITLGAVNQWSTISLASTNVRTIDFLGTGVSFHPFGIDNLQWEDSAPVPEPSTILLMGIGLLGLVGYSRKRKKS